MIPFERRAGVHDHEAGRPRSPFGVVVLNQLVNNCYNNYQFNFLIRMGDPASDGVL